MIPCKKGSSNDLTCDVCKKDFNSHADYALHAFSKKHCDNLIKLAKQKPVVSKQKNKTDCSEKEKEQPKVNAVTHTGSFSKYGYFIPGEIYASAETSKEFNTDYDPYLQKFAENPYKEKPSIPASAETAFCSITSFSEKKKKKVKTCQVCNVTLSTVPEYEAHMKSPQHIWKLKVTGMGVFAHFVKASTDLHTTDINEDSKPSIPTVEETEVNITSGNENPSEGPFPLLYCSDCELLLNSPQQYNAHVKGKFHIECAQKKAELKAKKEKLENPSPNQLYCYSCKISLNNLFQYNEHKNGKKHKAKCRNLIKRGITIPLEERVPGIPVLGPNKHIVYPELYEKLVLKKQEQIPGNLTGINDKDGKDITVESPFNVNSKSEISVSNQENSGSFKDDKEIKKDMKNLEVEHENGFPSETAENQSKTPKIIFHKNYEDSRTAISELDNPSPNQLYCYLCEVSLNNLLQYNEHKNGKKHKTKCRNLIKRGITIPFEERVPGIPVLSPNKHIVYPELYEKLVLKKQEQIPGNLAGIHDKDGRDINAESLSNVISKSEISVSNQENSSFVRDDRDIKKDMKNLEVEQENDFSSETAENQSKTPKIIFHKNYEDSQTATSELDNQSLEVIVTSQKDFSISKEKKDSDSQITIITDSTPVKCSICNEIFQWQSILDTHLCSEEHFRRILELKQNGTSENEILTAIFSDRNVIKPNNLGKLSCSICNVITDSMEEFDQHLKSIVHKYTLKDYKMKRTVEVKHIVGSNEQNIYFCTLCKEGWSSLIDYTQHLHCVRHKSIQREQRAKVILAKRSSYAQKKKIAQSLRKKKNPGVRTKICGVAVDLNSGAQAPVPNLETLEPKIDVTKNVSIGICEKTDDLTPCINNNNSNNSNNSNNNNKKLKVSNIKKRYKALNRKLQSNNPHPKNILRFFPSKNVIPPLIPKTPFHLRSSSFVPPFGNRAHYCSRYPVVFEPFCRRFPMGNPCTRPSLFQRAPWPGYR